MGVFDGMGWMGQNKPEVRVEPSPASTGTVSKPTDGTAAGTNDGGADDKTVDEIWLAAQKKDDPNATAPAVPAAPAQQPDAKDTMKRYLDEKGLGDFTIDPALMAQLKNGEGFDTLTANINSRIQTAHTQALASANTIIQAEVKKAVDSAVGQSRDFVNSTKLQEELHEKYPFAKDPAIGPVAETVLNRFIGKGATKEKAMELVGEYFRKVRDLVPPDELDTTTRGNTFSRPAPKKEVDWGSLLRAR